jgi:hypothetical protein
MKGMIELEICVLYVYNELDKLLKRVSMPSFISSSKLVVFSFLYFYEFSMHIPY